MSSPKTFISYSHDSIEHKEWVANLSIRLRNYGVDAILDQWDLRPGDDIPTYMEQQLSNSDFVIMICTNRYVDKANNGKGGVGYEKMIVTSELMGNIDQKKVIPIIKQEGTYHVPIFLKTKLFIDFSVDENYESNFDDLIRCIHGAPVLNKPILGKNPFKDIKQVENLKKGPELELMKELVNLFNTKTTNLHLKYDIAKENTRLSNILFHYAMDILVKKKYISISDVTNTKWIVLKNEGMFYSIDNGLT